MTDSPIQSGRLVLYRLLFLGNLLLLIGSLAIVILGLQMLHPPWVMFGAVAFGCALALREYAYERWHYHEIEEALDHVHASAGAADEDSAGMQRLQDLLNALDSDSASVWDRQKVR